MAVFSPKNLKGAAMFLCKALLAAMPAAAFLYVVYNYYPETDFWFKGFVVFAFLYLCLFLLLASVYRCFRIGTLRLREITFAFYLTVFLTNFIFYFILSLTAKMLLDALPLLVMTLVQCVLGTMMYAGADRLFYLLYPSSRSILIFSRDRHEMGTFGKLAGMQDRYTVGEIIGEEAGYDAIVEKLAGYSTVFLGSVESALRLALTDFCFEHEKRLLVVPTVEDIIFHNAHETFIGDSLVYLCRNRSFSLEQLIVKRLMDIGISLVGIVLTSPVMFFSAMMIKLQDGGPILFKQTRYTRNMETFTLYKFRSMVIDAEKDGARFTTPGDKRVTPYGNFMRRTRIDELPQFFNILKGEMSLVGPRAERVENVDYYMEMLPEFRYRMKVKAGLTGYAQIYGKYNTSYEDKLKLDMLYIENCSIVKDLQLLFLTLNVIFIPESTEGYEVESLSEMEQKEHARLAEEIRAAAEAAEKPDTDGNETTNDHGEEQT